MIFSKSVVLYIIDELFIFQNIKYSFIKYRKIKTSQSKIFTAPMASGRGLTDLVSRGLDGWGEFSSGPPRKTSWISFDSSENLQVP